ncbi:MAG TPA: OsmC family protein [Kofleriaceae bacterium]|jgi:organic hydroperoxide reductase OsmC/OhrA|nr:OsmC family protein [Kofleriaceae bacterium]
MAIMPFPHRYSVTLSDALLTAEPRPAIAVGAPPQFGGTDEVWSPEDLLVGAVLLCVKTTFDAFARKAGLAIHSWIGKATGVLDKGSAGATFTSVRIELDIETDSGAESRVRDLLGPVERACIISRAIRAPVDIVARIHERA